MNNQDYEQKKRECWKEFCKEHPLDATANGGVAFRYAFDRAYALGKQDKDAEGEEMLICSNLTCCRNGEGYLKKGQCDKIQCPNRSKCLPNNADSLSQNPSENCDNGNHISTDDNKPVEPKFKMGDIAVVRGFKHPLLEHDGAIVSILSYHEKGDFYSCAIAPNVGIDIDAKCLKPYTEPDSSHETPVCENHSDNTSQKEVNMNSNRNLSQETANCDKQLDNILKDGFRNERRLNIAAMVIASIMGSSDWSGYRGATNEDIWRNMAKASLGVADALIAECEKGGSDV